QALQVADGVQHRLVAGDRQAVDLLAVAGTIEDDVVPLTVVGEHVHRDLRVDDVLGQVLLDDALDLAQGHAGDVDAAVAAQADGAVGPHEVLAADLHLAAELGQRHRHLRVVDHAAQVYADRLADL